MGDPGPPLHDELHDELRRVRIPSRERAGSFQPGTPVKLDDVFGPLKVNEAFVQAASGAAGSMVSACVFYPLDLIRHMEQAQSLNMSLAVVWNRVRHKGVWWLYLGLTPTVFSTGLSDFVYFFVYHTLKSPHPITNLCVRCFAGVMNPLVTTPLWIATHRIRSSGGSMQLFTMIRSIIEKEGLLALWEGTTASLLLVANPIIYYFIYDALKRWYSEWICAHGQGRGQGGAVTISVPPAAIPSKEEAGEYRRTRRRRQQQEEEARRQRRIHYAEQQLSTAHYFLFGALSKCVATLCTFPLQVAQARSRERSVGGTRSTHGGVISPLRELANIQRTEGVQGWYNGLQTTVLTTVLNAALSQVQYEAILRLAGGGGGS